MREEKICIICEHYGFKYNKSFTYVTQRSGPKIDLLGTPQTVVRLHVFKQTASTNNFLFDR